MKTSPSPSNPGWFPKAVVALLGLQIGLGYLHGTLLHRQEATIRELRADVQDLAESIEASSSTTEEGDSYTPMRTFRRSRHAGRIQRVSQEEPADKEAEPGRKEAEQFRENAKKAAKDVDKAQKQLSLSENARKAEEKARLEKAEKDWTPYIVAGGALVLMALLVRAWLRRRG